MEEFDDEQPEIFTIKYSIEFGGEVREFVVNLDKETLQFIPANSPMLDEWAELEFEKCPNCTLDPASHKYCPVAVNLGEMVHYTNALVSYEEADVCVEALERKYNKRADMQSVASSLMGIVMVTSGCPILDKMRPMVESHLPFASWEETAYRFVTMYLFGQYFRHKRGEVPDWDMDGLVKLFDDIEQVNTSFCARLDKIRTKDAGVNAVSILNSMTMLTRMSVEAQSFNHWEKLFGPYCEG